MGIVETILIAIVLIVAAAVFAAAAAILRRPAPVIDLREVTARLDSLDRSIERLDRASRDDGARNREEWQAQANALRAELQRYLEVLGNTVRDQISTAGEAQNRHLQRVADELGSIQKVTDQRLEQMRKTVDEQLQGTLEKRLGESFRLVSERLEQVYKGLGEMQTLASGVGDLKRVFSDVRARGAWGEIQLGALLEQMLAPGQYARNVAPGGTAERVEFAICMPGTESGATVWLPIDAKFPQEDYLRLVDASDRGEAAAVESCRRQLEQRVRMCARDISTKYIRPPATTDFAILYLPTESLYAEILRRAGLVEELQRDHRVAVAGPTTLAALLNSLQMGFQTLAIQKQSSEVWRVLGQVRTEFGKYADVLARVQKKLQEASNTVDQGLTRTRVLERRLRDVESPGNNREIDFAETEDWRLASGE
jgi:DNA recombination protein RmuC